MKAIIGMVQIDPAEVSGDSGEYIVAFPAGSRALCVGWVDDSMVLWVSVPVPLLGETPELVKRRFLVLPGARLVNIPDWAQYVGTVISRDEDGEAFHDWHVFSDSTGVQVYGAAQSTYNVH